MNLRYIALGLDREQFDNDYRYGFEEHTRFISNYFSKSIRKFKFVTDGTFDMISIDGMLHTKEPRIVPLNVLNVHFVFDKNRYEEIKGTKNVTYYLELLEQGFIKASDYKKIPLETLLELIEEFKMNGCINEWVHKKKKFKNHDLEIILTCEFTTNYFQLIIIINKISIKEELTRGVVIKTQPNEVLFEGMFKDVFIDENIIITDESNDPIIIIDKADALNGKLNYKINGNEEIVEILSYKMG